MTDMPDDRIILCQPDTNKGCSLCCGLFNFRDLSRHNLSGYLEDGKLRENFLNTHDDYCSPADVRDKFSHICPYQGFLSKGKPGCLIHPQFSGIDGRGRSLFAGKICSEFFCPAHSILTREEKLFLINNVTDWYLYSAALSDPESYSFIYNYVKDNFGGEDSQESAFPCTGSALINKGLAAHAENLAGNEGIIFCYSIPEYNMNKKNFCIRYLNEKRDFVVSQILKASAAIR